MEVIGKVQSAIQMHLQVLWTSVSYCKWGYTCSAQDNSIQQTIPVPTKCQTKCEVVFVSLFVCLTIWKRLY